MINRIITSVMALGFLVSVGGMGTVKTARADHHEPAKVEKAAKSALKCKDCEEKDCKGKCEAGQCKDGKCKDKCCKGKKDCKDGKCDRKGKKKCKDCEGKDDKADAGHEEHHE